MCWNRHGGMLSGTSEGPRQNAAVARVNGGRLPRDGPCWHRRGPIRAFTRGARRRSSQLAGRSSQRKRSALRDCVRGRFAGAQARDAERDAGTLRWGHAVRRARTDMEEAAPVGGARENKDLGCVHPEPAC